MNDNGWIKIRKSIYNHWLWQDAEYLKWWIDLLLMANWEDDEKLVGKQLVTLKRGQLIASMSFLMNRWDRSRKMIEHFLNLLQEKEMITKEVKHNISIITITNYDKHQGNDKEAGKEQNKSTKGANKGAHLESDLTCNKSNICDTNNTEQGAHLGAIESTHLGAHLGTHLGAYQGATIKEDKEDKEDKDNNRLLNSNLCYNSNELQPSDTCACEEVEILEAEVISDRFPWKKIQTMWNTICTSYPKLISISETRKNKVRARVKEMGGESESFKTFELLFHKLEESNFLRGDNKKGWRATFDWLFTNSNNWVKVYEGTYDNDRQIQHQQTYGNNTKQTTYEQRAATVARIVEEGIAASREELRNRGRVPDPVLPF